MNNAEPLASRLRPNNISDFLGQSHLLFKGSHLHESLTSGSLHSMILWGPPGTGKTTLAKLLAKSADAVLEELSAVLCGVKDIRAAIERAKLNKKENINTILFVDEVHRFNKSQQDAFLPFVENGLITFIGATTENPSFELNNALLSRASVYVLKALSHQELKILIDRALQESTFSLDCPELLIQSCGGDARKCLNYLELSIQLATSANQSLIDKSIIKQVLMDEYRPFDKGGDYFYDQISALHKSIRGSAPDASLFWCLSMLKSGCTVQYILRRLLRIASEDIGNADPRAQQVVLNAWDSFERLGMPEGELSIAQAVLYLACAPKSNAVYLAYKNCKSDIETHNQIQVPLHLRNAPTKLAKSLNHSRNYKYPHDYPDAYVAKENYFPEGVDAKYYFPVNRGLEIKIKQKLEFLQQIDSTI